MLSTAALPMATLLGLWLLAAGVWDWLRRRVPNALVGAGAAVALLALAIQMHPMGAPWQQLLLASAGAAGFLLLFYALGLMGAADVKFAAALALWVGLEGVLWIWVGASLLAGLHSVALVVQRRGAVLARSRRREVPYVSYLAFSALVWCAWQWGIQ